MGCGNKISDTCGGKKTTATCVKYEGEIPDYSDLNECDCYTVEEVTEDIYTELGDVKEEIDLEGLESDCIDFTLTNGKVLVKDAIFALTEKVCEIEALLPSEEPECEGCIDPCEIDGCSTGLVYSASGGGELQISSEYSQWQTALLGYTDLTYNFTRKGKYKITLEVNVIAENSASDTCLLGISINNEDPNSNVFRSITVFPGTLNYTIQTYTFLYLEALQSDNLKIKFKNISGELVAFDGIKMIIEKV